MKFKNIENKTAKKNISILDDVKDPLEDVNDYLAAIMIDNLNCSLDIGEFPKSFKGVATCNSEDDYNSNKGRIIAETKASMKYHNAMIHNYSRYLKALFKIHFILEKRLNDHAKKYDKLMRKYLELGFPDVTLGNENLLDNSTN